jgi:transposase
MDWNWNSTWFTDEKKFNLDGPDCTKFYCHDLRKEPEVASRRQAVGGSVMVWAGFSARGKTSICFVTRILNSQKYQDVLQNHLVPLLQTGDHLIQDNAPIHVSQSTLDWLELRQINRIHWPSRSPDLSPMENLWAALVRRIYAEGKQFSSVGSLREAILNGWEAIELAVIRNHAESMPGRIFECIGSKGSYTTY